MRDSRILKIDYGDGAVDQLPAHIGERGWRRVLLVCGRTSFEASGAARIMPTLAANAEIHRWSDFAPNTDSADLMRGIKVLRGFEPDAVVAIGGGSAMDMAKLLCAYHELGDSGAVMAAIRGGARVDSRRLGLCVVPTTSGSGSEATHFAVVYIGESKFSIAGPGIYPDLAILDPTLAMSGSAYQRATSGIDAVCQAIESLWAKGATNRSRIFARRALYLLLPHIEAFVASPTPIASRAMMMGSHLAGRAIDISKTTAAHALAYTITKRYGISHGHAVAMSLGRLIEAHAEADPHRLQGGIDLDSHTKVMKEIENILQQYDGNSTRLRFSNLLNRIGLHDSLHKIGMTKLEQIKYLLSTVNIERLSNNPLILSESDFLEIFQTR